MAHSFIHALKSGIKSGVQYFGYDLVRKSPPSDADTADTTAGLRIEGGGVPGTPFHEMINLLESYAAPLATGKRILVWLFERTGATGHLSMEPNYIKSVYGHLYDDIIVITRHRHSCHRSNVEIFDASMAGMKVACTDDPRILNLSAHEIGIVERGPFTFLLHSFSFISRAFFYHCLGGGTRKYMSLLPEQEERGRAVFAKLGIPAGSKWVVAHAREPGFHQRSYDNFRCTNVESYFDSVRFLTEQGYFVLRLGDRSMKRLPDMGPMVIDVPFLDAYDPIIDVYGAAHCEFLMSSFSGPCELTRAFDRPILAVNVCHQALHIPRKMEMLAPRRFFKSGDGGRPRSLGYQELIDLNVPSLGTNGMFTEAGISYELMDAAEILPLTREMLARCTNPCMELPPHHDRFVAINRETQRKYQHCPARWSIRSDWWGPAVPGAIIPSAYCEQFPYFL